MTTFEERVRTMMKNLDCTYEEAVETIKADDAIDKMSTKQIKESYTAEERQAIKEATKTGKKKTVYKFEKKTRPKDAEKVEIVKSIFEFLSKVYMYTDCIIKNEGQEITFKSGENEYSLVLTKHRTPKGDK